MMGYYGQNPGSDLGGFEMDFNHEPPVFREVDTNISFQNTVGGISDRDGNLLFYTNGITVIGNDYEVIENGDSLNTYGISLDYQDDGMPIPQGVFDITSSIK